MFVQSRAPTLGVEFGAENRHSFGLYRLWNYYSFSKGVVSLDKKYSTTAVRLGLDSYFNIVNAGRLQFGVLVFGLIDYTSISASASSSSEDVDDSKLKNVSIMNGYLGTGLTVNW